MLLPGVGVVLRSELLCDGGLRILGWGCSASEAMLLVGLELALCASLH